MPQFPHRQSGARGCPFLTGLLEDGWVMRCDRIILYEALVCPSEEGDTLGGSVLGWMVGYPGPGGGHVSCLPSGAFAGPLDALPGVWPTRNWALRSTGSAWPLGAGRMCQPAPAGLACSHLGRRRSLPASPASHPTLCSIIVRGSLECVHPALAPSLPLSLLFSLP